MARGKETGQLAASKEITKRISKLRRYKNGEKFVQLVLYKVNGER